MAEKKSIIGKIGDLYSLSNKIWIFVALIGIGFASLYFGGPSAPQQVQVLGCNETPDNQLLPQTEADLQTEFSIAKIDVAKDTFSYNISKNYIPAVDTPKFSNFEQMGKCLKDTDILVMVSDGKTTKLYPRQILVQHLAVNDIVGSTPVVVTYCGFCDSYAVYKSTNSKEILKFGVSGYFYKNNDMLFDRKTESLWTQFSGEALIGSLTGAKLEHYPFELVTYKQAKAMHPDAQIMTFDTGYRRNYLEDPFSEFAKSSELISPVFNSSEKLRTKQLVVGFAFQGKYYAFTPDTMPDKLELGKATITFSKEDAVISAKVTATNARIQLYQAYWYVWYDFYPQLALISQKAS
jgi:hypothetical protein